MSKLNILVAYPYMKANVIQILKENQDHIRFVLDSGAFTAWKAGKPIHVDDYCRFLESLPFEPWRYFALDVIGDPHGTMKNYETMLSRGFKPIPIFTRGENPSVLDDYYKTSDVVGIGGLVGTPGNKGFVKGIMKHVRNRRVHWLGFSSDQFIFHYKPYMCDSSSWSSSFRYASAKVYAGAGRWIPFTKNTYKESYEKLSGLVKDLGVDPLKLLNDKEWTNENRELEFAIETLTHRTWVKYQHDLLTKFNVNFFLACTTNGQVRLMVRAYNYWKDRGIIK